MRPIFFSFNTIEKVRAAGINVIGNYIFGLPEDDAATMQATLDLALELNYEFGNFYSTMAYPGPPLYGLALRTGWGSSGKMERVLATFRGYTAVANETFVRW